MPGRHHTPVLRDLLVPVLAALGACGTESSAPIDRAGVHAATTPVAAANADAAGLLKSVASATARFHSQVQATKAGHAVASPCVAAPGLGGMGSH